MESSTIKSLGKSWHRAGTVHDSALDEMERLSVKGQRSIESGTGRSTLLLSQYGRHTVFTIDDAGEGSSLSAVKASPLLAPDTDFVLGPTQKTFPRYDFEPLDFALLDGPHAYPFPEIEYYFVYPHLKPGAVLVIDDIHLPTVRRLWTFLVKDDMFEKISVKRTTGFLRRTSAPTFDPTGDGWEHQRFNRTHPRHKFNYANNMARWAVRTLIGPKR
jgi:predicted O-methyltransferase YrrM